MAKQVKLAAQSRTGVGRSAVTKLKQNGFVPATIYGGQDAPQNLQLVSREIETVLSHAIGENILVELEIDADGAKTNRLALIQEVQHHPLRRNVLHVDFHAVKADQTISAEVPIEPTGIADGVKNFGGLLEQSIRALEIECLPKDLPELIQVDVSGLGIGDSIHVKHLMLPEGVTTTVDPDLTVFIVAEPTVAAEPVAAEAAPTAPEVIKEKKEETPAAEKEKK